MIDIFGKLSSSSIEGLSKAIHIRPTSSSARQFNLICLGPFLHLVPLSHVILWQWSQRGRVSVPTVLSSSSFFFQSHLFWNVTCPLVGLSDSTSSRDYLTPSPARPAAPHSVSQSVSHSVNTQTSCHTVFARLSLWPSCCCIPPTSVTCT